MDANQENGDLYVWGEYQATKSCAQCNHRDPFLVSKAIEGQIVSIACGPHQTIAVTSTYSQSHDTHDMHGTHGTRAYVCLITWAEDHRVWAWGGGVLKNITNGHADLHQFHRPTLVEAFDGYKVAQVACGDFNVVGLTGEPLSPFFPSLSVLTFVESQKCVHSARGSGHRPRPRLLQEVA